MDNVSDIYCVSIQCPSIFTVYKIRPRGKFNFAHRLDRAFRSDCIPLDYSGNTRRRWHGSFAVAVGCSGSFFRRRATGFGDLCGAGRSARFEVVSVNDRSQDRTPEILHGYERTNSNLKVIDIADLPAGWLGKPHALVAGFEQSKGEWLVFTDADVHFAPDVLRRAVALAQERQRDHLTLLASIEMRGFWEITAITFFGLGFVIGNEPWQASNTRSGRYVGVGAFQLVRRAAYEKSGGHHRLRMDVIEDMKLGKLIKMAGLRSGVAVAQDMVRVRWHSGLQNVIRGVTKNMFAACHYNALLALVAMSLPLIMSVLPFFGLAFATGWARVFAGIAVGAAILIHAAMIWSTSVSPFYAFTHPLGAVIFSWMLARSAIATLLRGGVVWRDTFYPLEELRKGLV